MTMTTNQVLRELRGITNDGAVLAMMSQEQLDAVVAAIRLMELHQQQAEAAPWCHQCGARLAQPPV